MTDKTDRKICEASTPGYWERSSIRGIHLRGQRRGPSIPVSVEQSNLITHFNRAKITSMLDEIDALKAKNEQLKKKIINSCGCGWESPNVYIECEDHAKIRDDLESALVREQELQREICAAESDLTCEYNDRGCGEILYPKNIAQSRGWHCYDEGRAQND